MAKLSAAVTRRRMRRGAVVAIAGIVLGSQPVAVVPAHAQSYPARPITVVVGLAPGSGQDATARTLTRRAGELLGVQIVIQPVFINPLLNHYTPLPDSPVKQQILSLARANGIPADNVYEFDASRQSNRISANVSGFFGTTRISMTDNLMKQATPSEIKAVLAKN